MNKEVKELSLEEIREAITKEAEESLKDPYVFKNPIKRVAVIGSGPSGLCSARRLRDIGLSVKVFERNSTVGGLWIYSERPPVKTKIPSSRVTRTTDTSLLSVSASADAPDRKIFEMTPELKNKLLLKTPPSAVYRDLYSNSVSKLSELPGFSYPEGTPDFVPHHVVRDYYQSYAEHFDLLPLCEFDTSVDLVTKNDANNTWDVVVSKYDVYSSGMVREQKWKETFDAVVVATGQHHDAYVPDFKDLTAFNKIYPDKVLHSEQYRRPEDFKDKNVLIIGGMVSAIDISCAIEGIANNVTVSMKDEFESPHYIVNVFRGTIPKSVSIKSNVEAFSNADGVIDGTVRFEDGSHLKDIDYVLFCTGFVCRLPFLGDLVRVQTAAEVPPSHVVMGPNFPRNAFHEVFVTSDPTLAFAGHSPSFAKPGHFDAHANAIARVWAGRAFLPNNLSDAAEAFETGISPFMLFEGDRRRREPFVTWLNLHATATGQELPPVENYDDGYEEQGISKIQEWVKHSTATYKAAKERILKSL